MTDNQPAETSRLSKLFACMHKKKKDKPFVMTCAVVFLPVFWECDTQAIFSEREALVQWQNLRILQCRVTWNQEIVKAELRCRKKKLHLFSRVFSWDDDVQHVEGVEGIVLKAAVAGSRAPARV